MSHHFQHSNIDLVGLLPPSGGNRYILLIDRGTRWIELFPVADIYTTIDQVFFGSVGMQFTSTLWSNVCTCLGVNHRLTSAFHLESNGLIERIHCNFKSALRVWGSTEAWSSDLPLILLELRAALREQLFSDGIFSFEPVYRAAPNHPGDFWTKPEVLNSAFLTRFQQILANQEPLQIIANRNVTPSIPLDLMTCKFVYIHTNGSR